MALKGSLKGLYNLGRIGASKAVKSDFAKNKLKSMTSKYLDQVLDSITGDISKKLDPIHGGAFDLHKAILKIAPKKGFVMPGHRYTGPGNPLEQQLKYDPNTGQILEIFQQPTGKTDAVSMQHDVDYSVCGNKPKSYQVKCKMMQIVKWLRISILFLGKKDNGGMLLLVIPLQPRQNWVWVLKRQKTEKAVE